MENKPAFLRVLFDVTAVPNMLEAKHWYWPLSDSDGLVIVNVPLPPVSMKRGLEMFRSWLSFFHL